MKSIICFQIKESSHEKDSFKTMNRKQTFTMKAIILISSIFYILGLKIGHKIDLVKKENPVKTISIATKVEKPEKCCEYANELVKKTDCDTIIGGSSYSDAILKNIEF